MFTIKNGAEIKQWTNGNVLVNPCMNVGDKVFFRGANGSVYIMLATAEGVEVPNILVQMAKPILVDLENHNECRTRICVTAAEKTDDYVITDFSYFHCAGARLELLGKLDTSNSTSFSYMFSECGNLTTIPELDTSKGEKFTYMFRSCKSLTTIPKLDISNGYEFTAMFASCAALTNLYLYNIRRSIQIGSGTSWGHLLTVDSLVHTIKELCASKYSNTLTIGSANLEKIAGLYCRITDDTNEKKTMELCESTDEGAIT